MHLNDSKKKLGAELTGITVLAKGEIGIDGLALFFKILGLMKPLIPETIDNEIWAEEINLLRGFEMNPLLIRFVSYSLNP